ncbi:hypothetical protein VNO77_31201 [Canavalia gladiata]|uniref:Protein kinase domain-containing protein n=1 Tax=Canavalia gladiata TaxID=3824 RepID=A0AAN9KS95_CANGL
MGVFGMIDYVLNDSDRCMNDQEICLAGSEASLDDNKARTSGALLMNVIGYDEKSGSVLKSIIAKYEQVDTRSAEKGSHRRLSDSDIRKHDPIVMHGDLKCNNIFVGGRRGQVGDPGSATILRSP